jgi:NAD-dependent DNA ligase
LVGAVLVASQYHPSNIPQTEIMTSLNGKSIVFTGTLTMKRADAKKQAEAAGAKVLAAVR